MWRKRLAAVMVVLLLAMIVAPLTNGVVEAELRSKQEDNHEYIVKWLYAPIHPSDGYRVLEHDEKLKVSLIKLYSSSDNYVLERLQRDPNVDYIEKNASVTIHANNTTFDTSQQYYLDITGLRVARDLVEHNTDLTIAVLDTGVDLTHPDLVGNLVTGQNMFDNKKPPQDDHGHGTMVAGIIASTGKDRSGYEGILPKVNIMPIKVMLADGRGDSLKVSQGIRYAVDNGADIISLSLADILYSKKMREEVEYAESKGVLVVAVTGNGGNRVEYPAAYPTVLAVGAIDQYGNTAAYSNYGPEVDVVAPGSRIYAPKLGGGYITSTGTSMAGPQVVGLAALIMSKYPDYTPADIRNLIRYSADDIGTMNWNQWTGYGKINAINALILPMPADIFEPNGSAVQAKVAPLGKQVDAKLTDGNDKDWYKITVPYDGKLRLDWKRNTANRTTFIKVALLDEAMNEVASNSSRNNAGFEAVVNKGTYFIRVEAASTLSSDGLSYSLISSFRIYDDMYGNNDTAATAYPISLTQKELIGTLSKDFEEDWFEFNIPVEGEFSFEVYTDTLSLDPIVTIIRPNGQRLVFDDTGFRTGNREKGENIKVTPGKLRVGIRNYYEQATNGEYTFEWDYKPEIVDIHEPNNSIFAAKQIKLNEPVYGFIASVADYDYFKFTVAEEGLYQVEGANFPAKVRPSMSLYNPKYERIAILQLKDNETSFRHQVWLSKGTYFVRLDARTKFTDQLYSLMVSKQDSAFKDLGNNWARESINRLVGLGVISGYSDKTFRPSNNITRAEFVHLLVKSTGVKSSTGTLPFTDVKSNYWARDSILAAYQKGLITGYQDNTFRPEDTITRSEMVAMLARGLEQKPVQNSNQLRANGQLAVQKFKDINNTTWYTDALSILLQLDMITGYQDGSFRPAAKSSRAEVAVMLERIWYAR